MPSLNFQERFAPLVETGRKRQTIRPKGKRRWRVGDTAYLFTGMRTKACRRLGKARIVNVADIMVYDSSAKDFPIILRNPGAWLEQCVSKDLFAQADGFGCWEEMREWFRERYGLPFSGLLIQWGPIHGQEEAADADGDGRAPA